MVLRNACDNCHQRKMRCLSEADGPCMNCKSRGKSCTYSPRSQMGRPLKYKTGSRIKRRRDRNQPSIEMTSEPQQTTPMSNRQHEPVISSPDVRLTSEAESTLSSTSMLWTVDSDKLDNAIASVVNEDPCDEYASAKEVQDKDLRQFSNSSWDDTTRSCSTNQINT